MITPHCWTKNRTLSCHDGVAVGKLFVRRLGSATTALAPIAAVGLSI
jgi:hypothetical protein